MIEKQRNSFTSQFKAKVALEAIRGEKTLNELAKEFGVHPTQVGQWKRELQENAAGLFEVKRGPKAVDPAADPEKLYTEIGRLKVQLDWLKNKRGRTCDAAEKLDQQGGRLAGHDTMRPCRSESDELLQAGQQAIAKR
jgi:transposase